jgi:haloacid dehalogenase-like hydrolase/Transposase DDE domain group 1
VRAALDDGAFVARSQPYYLDITHPLANKGAARRKIAKLLGIPLAEIAVIGDGGNDVAMFERAGLSIAMGNASAEVQREADLVTWAERYPSSRGARSASLEGRRPGNGPSSFEARENGAVALSQKSCMSRFGSIHLGSAGLHRRSRPTPPYQSSVLYSCCWARIVRTHRDCGERLVSPWSRTDPATVLFNAAKPFHLGIVDCDCDCCPHGGGHVCRTLSGASGKQRRQHAAARRSARTLATTRSRTHSSRRRFALSCKVVRLQLHALAYNLGNFLRTLATPEPIKDWSMTTMREKPIKVGANVVGHAHYVSFQIGCYTAQRLRRHLAHDRGTSATSNHVNGVVSSVVTCLNETTGKVCLYNGKFRISPRSPTRASVRTTVEGRRRRHACQNSPVGTDLGSYWLPSGECRLSAPQPKKSCGIVQDFSISRHYTSTNGPFVIEFGKWRSTLR